MTRQQEFKRGDFVRRRASLAAALVACLVAFALLGLAPPRAARERPAVPPPVLPTFVELAKEIVVPPPPAEVRRSVTPDADPRPWAEEVSDAPEAPEPPKEVLPSGPAPAAVTGESFVVFDDPPHPRRMAVVEYPEVAREAGIEGWVLCAIRIDEEGLVTEVRILDGSSELFHEAARAALLRATFTPARQSGRAVACMVVQRIEFGLD